MVIAPLESKMKSKDLKTYKAYCGQRYRSYSPSKVATQARMASRAAVLSPGDGSVDCWGRHTASRSQSHSPTWVCLFFSFSLARAPPLKQGQMDTVTVPVLVRPDVPSRRTSGTWSVRLEAAERDSGCNWDSRTRLAVGPESRRRSRFKKRRHSCGKADFFFSFFGPFTIKMTIDFTSTFLPQNFPAVNATCFDGRSKQVAEIYTKMIMDSLSDDQT